MTSLPVVPLLDIFNSYDQFLVFLARAKIINVTNSKDIRDIWKVVIEILNSNQIMKNNLTPYITKLHT